MSLGFKESELSWSFNLLKLVASTTANLGNMLRFGKQRYPGIAQDNERKRSWRRMNTPRASLRRTLSPGVPLHIYTFSQTLRCGTPNMHARPDDVPASAELCVRTQKLMCTQSNAMTDLERVCNNCSKQATGQ